MALICSEAVTLLIRLMGKEEAQGLPYAAPFDDLPYWARPYVNYAYRHGLTDGVSAAGTNAGRGKRPLPPVVYCGSPRRCVPSGAGPSSFPAARSRFFQKTVDFAARITYNNKAFERCVEKSRSLVERARLEIVYTP